MSAGRVFIADPVAPICAEILRAGGLEVSAEPGLPPAELKQRLSGVAGLVVRSETKVTEEVLASAPELKVVGRAGTGVDNIDVVAATRRGVVVMNAPGENTIAAAEHTFSLMLALARNIPAADRSLKSGRWERGRFLGVELYGKTLGVIGLGKIGREVAARARAFGMEVRAFDPYVSEEMARRLGFVAAPLSEVLSGSDFITLHVPLNQQTRHLLGEAEMAQCRPGTRLINCARGGLVDEAALERAIRDGRIRGAALDVFEKEPPGADHPLLERDEVVATPHLGASTVEAQEKVAIRVAEQIVAYLTRGAVAGAVNVESLDPEAYRMIAPWVDLAERLGRLQARLAPKPAAEAVVEFSGALLEHPVHLLAAAFLKGYLEGMVSEPVNLVNAPVVAREMGLRVQEVRSSDSADYTSLIATTLRSVSAERTLSGTLFGKRVPRIVRLDDYHFDAAPDGEMLICSNDDRPGMLGLLGSVVGAAGINIANLSLGRDRIGGTAIAIFNLDSPIEPELLEKIRALNGIRWAERARL